MMCRTKEFMMELVECERYEASRLTAASEESSRKTTKRPHWELAKLWYFEKTVAFKVGLFVGFVFCWVRIGT